MLVVCCFIALFIIAGFWQMDRYQGKLYELESIERRAWLPSREPVKLRGVDNPRYFPVKVSGNYINDESFLLDNRVVQGVSGYHLITPFMMTDNRILLVNRGWIKGDIDKSILPSFEPVLGHKQIKGMAWQPLGKAIVFGKDEWSEKWPKVIQSLVIDRMSANFEVSVESWFLVLDEYQPGIMKRDFHPINIQPNKHLGYAFQWFVMALALGIYSGYYLCKMRKNKGSKGFL